MAGSAGYVRHAPRPVGAPCPHPVAARAWSIAPDLRAGARSYLLGELLGLAQLETGEICAGLAFQESLEGQEPAQLLGIRGLAQERIARLEASTRGLCAALRSVQVPEAGERHALLVLVADLAADSQRGLAVGLRLVQLVLSCVQGAEAGEHSTLALEVADLTSVQGAEVGYALPSGVDPYEII
jgi:hypothetical protein